MQREALRNTNVQDLSVLLPPVNITNFWDEKQRCQNFRFSSKLKPFSSNFHESCFMCSIKHHGARPLSVCKWNARQCPKFTYFVWTIIRNCSTCSGLLRNTTLRFAVLKWREDLATFPTLWLCWHGKAMTAQKFLWMANDDDRWLLLQKFLLSCQKHSLESISIFRHPEQTVNGNNATNFEYF